MHVAGRPEYPTLRMSARNGLIRTLIRRRPDWLRRGRKWEAMLNRFAKLLLVATSFAPVLATYAFIEYLQNGLSVQLFSWLGAVAGLVALCLLVLWAANTKLERMRFKVTSVKSADHEIVGFVLAYMLPLANMGTEANYGAVLWFVLLVFFAVVWTTNSYHVNPLLGVFGYHFYEVTTDDGVAFLLLTRKGVQRSRTDLTVVQLTNYIVMDVKDGE